MATPPAETRRNSRPEQWRLTEAKRLVIGLAVGAVLLPTACAGGTHNASSPRTPTTGTRVHRLATTISARVMLPSKTIVAGSTVDAKVIVENNTGSALNVLACGSPFAVELAKDNIQPVVEWPACRQTLTIPVGKSSYTTPVSASYLGCGNRGPFPRCVDGPHPHPPPLPTGEYQAKLYQNPTVDPAPIPTVVHVRA
jgi:hypothetical protein